MYCCDIVCLPFLLNVASVFPALSCRVANLSFSLYTSVARLGAGIVDVTKLEESVCCIVFSILAQHI
jgi:hypothetical protein